MNGYQVHFAVSLEWIIRMRLQPRKQSKPTKQTLLPWQQRINCYICYMINQGLTGSLKVLQIFECNFFHTFSSYCNLDLRKTGKTLLTVKNILALRTAVKHFKQLKEYRQYQISKWWSNYQCMDDILKKQNLSNTVSKQANTPFDALLIHVNCSSCLFPLTTSSG